VSAQNHTLYAPAVGITPAMGPKQVRPPKNRTRNDSPLPSNGPSARTTSDSGVPAGKKRASSSPLEELGIEYQLQLARCFRLSLPVLGLEKLGVGNELRIA